MPLRKLRDAVHGDIRLTDAEFAVLDTPQMQRLRGIRQLGAAYYVYPSAQHSRFEHCLGTCWMARRIMDETERETGFRFDEVERQAVGLAALAHDVTHIPFGHTFEDERRLLERHDRSADRYERLVAGGELGERLAATEPGRLALRLLDPSGRAPAGGAYLRDIVSGTICADLLDYLKRDNYFCGLSCNFDDRVLQYFRIVDGRLAVDMQQGGIFRRDALSEITNLLRIRYLLSERVYYHHAKMAAGVMISKAVEGALAEGLTEADLCTLTDDALIYHLRSRLGAMPVGEVLADFEGRRLFKRCYMVTREVGEAAVAALVRDHHLNESGRRDQAERRIAQAAGVPLHHVAIYCAPAGMALKEADVPVTLPATAGAPGGQVSLLSALNSDEVQVLKRQHQGLWKLYVFLSARSADRLPAAAASAAEVIGFPNELPAERRGGRL